MLKLVLYVRANDREHGERVFERIGRRALWPVAPAVGDEVMVSETSDHKYTVERRLHWLSQGLVEIYFSAPKAELLELFKHDSDGWMDPETPGAADYLTWDNGHHR